MWEASPTPIRVTNNALWCGSRYRDQRSLPQPIIWATQQIAIQFLPLGDGRPIIVVAREVDFLIQKSPFLKRRVC
jgi:hypothetical protein